MAREYELHYRERMVVWVWERMEAAHGERWRRVYGSVWDEKRERERKAKPHLWPRLARTARIWADRLVELESEAIGRAVEACEERDELPTLPGFLALCRGDNGLLEERHARPVPESPEQRTARRRRGESELANIHALLRG